MQHEHRGVLTLFLLPLERFSLHPKKILILVQMVRALGSTNCPCPIVHVLLLQKTKAYTSRTTKMPTCPRKPVSVSSVRRQKTMVYDKKKRGLRGS